MDEMRVFDRRLVRLRRDRAAATVARVAPVLEDCGGAAARPAGRHDAALHPRARPRRAGRGGAEARGAWHPLRRLADLSPPWRAAPAGCRGGRRGGPPFAPESFDLVVASLSLHWVNDLPGALIQIRRALAPDGLFLASVPGLGTLQPLREALAQAEATLRGGLSPRVSPFPELRDAAGLLQRAGFALPVADAEEVPIAYRSALSLFADLRAAGEANAVLAADRRTPPRALFPMAAAGLPQGPEGIAPGLRLILLTGWAPHGSQQQPARPGSATARLADALGTVERKAGERPGGG
jgi:SAM-dependent methyltransferase